VLNTIRSALSAFRQYIITPGWLLKHTAPRARACNTEIVLETTLLRPDRLRGLKKRASRLILSVCYLRIGKMASGGDRAEQEVKVVFEAARDVTAGTAATFVFFLLYYGVRRRSKQRIG
jgi:hypothetical protein